MAHGRLATVGDYLPLHITTSGTGVRVGSSSAKGTYLGIVTINQPGTGATLTLYNGDPVGSGVAFAVLSLSSRETMPFHCFVPAGLFYTLAYSSAPDLTITYLDAPPAI